MLLLDLDEVVEVLGKGVIFKGRIGESVDNAFSHSNYHFPCQEGFVLAVFFPLLKANKALLPLMPEFLNITGQRLCYLHFLWSRLLLFLL